MAKQTFTPAGVQAKVAELYALPDADLQREAALIRSDLKTWLGNNFSFDTGQTAFLFKIDTRYLLQAGGVTATAVSSRLPVSLVAPTPPGGYSSKYIIIADHLDPRFDSLAGYRVTGSVQYTIGYVI